MALGLYDGIIITAFITIAVNRYEGQQQQADTQDSTMYNNTTQITRIQLNKV